MERSLLLIFSYLEQHGSVREYDMEGDICFPSDAIKLVTIFPLEIWELVMGHLENDDSQTLCNSSPFFRKRLLPKRKLFLFRNTFQHLVPYLVRSEGEEGTSSSILGCREVCQAWNQAVDYYFADLETSVKITKFAKHFRENCILRKAHEKSFSNIDNGGATTIEKFIQHFQIHPASSKRRNPFIGKTVRINYSEYFDQNDRFKNAINRLFQKYGEHIRFLEISLSTRSRTEYYYSALALWFSHVEKVQFLKINGPPVVSPRFLSLPVNSIPKFQNLTSLMLCGNLPTSLVKTLILKNSENLTELELKQEISHSAKNGLYYASFPNLRKFSGIISSMDQLFNLAAFLNSCQLQKLELHHFKANSDAAGYLDCFDILKLCALKWGKILKQLTLVLPYEITAEIQQAYLHESKNLRLNFPQLKSFELNVKSHIYLDFLLGANTTLENVNINSYWESSTLSSLLAIEGRAGVGNYSMQRVQYLGYEHRMHASNIWNLFPKLELVCTFPFGGLCIFQRSKLPRGRMFAIGKRFYM